MHSVFPSASTTATSSFASSSTSVGGARPRVPHPPPTGRPPDTSERAAKRRKVASAPPPQTYTGFSTSTSGRAGTKSSSGAPATGGNEISSWIAPFFCFLFQSFIASCILVGYLPLHEYGQLPGQALGYLFIQNIFQLHVHACMDYVIFVPFVFSILEAEFGECWCSRRSWRCGFTFVPPHWCQR